MDENCIYCLATEMSALDDRVSTPQHSLIRLGCSLLCP